MLVPDIPGYGVVAGGEVSARVWQTAVYPAVEVDLVAFCRLEQYPSLGAETCSGGCPAPYFASGIVVLVPSPGPGREYGSPEPQVPFLIPPVAGGVEGGVVGDFPVVRADIIPDLFHGISAGETGYRVVFVVFVPVRSPEQVCYLFILPCRVVLVVAAGLDLPVFVEPEGPRYHGTRLGVTGEIVAQDVHGTAVPESLVRCTCRRDTLAVAVGSDDGIPVHQSAVCPVGTQGLAFGFGPSSASAAYGEVDGVVHCQPFSRVQVPQGEVRLEIIVLVEVICPAAAVAPVLVVFQAVGADFLDAELCGALLVLLRGAEGGEKKGVAPAYAFAQVEHVGPGIYICPVDIAVTSDV